MRSWCCNWSAWPRVCFLPASQCRPSVAALIEWWTVADGQAFSSRSLYSPFSHVEAGEVSSRQRRPWWRACLLVGPQARRVTRETSVICTWEVSDRMEGALKSCLHVATTSSSLSLCSSAILHHSRVGTSALVALYFDINAFSRTSRFTQTFHLRMSSWSRPY